MKKNGTVEALNVSPKGFYEGFLLKTAKGVIQINYPKHRDADAADSLKPGEQITADVEPEEPHGSPAHPVFRLVRLHGGDADVFSGTVTQLNYALHGEVNGAILDSGDFLHLKPEGAHAAGLAIGMKVEGRGAKKPMVGGHSVIEAEEVNGMKIRHGHAKKKHAAKHARSR